MNENQPNPLPLNPGACVKNWIVVVDSPSKVNGNLKVESSKTKLDQVEEESQKGRFGWHSFAKDVDVPYIMRKEKKYCAVRMATKAISTFIAYINPIVYSECTNIPSYYVTQAECKLLDEINSFHCDYQYGTTEFSLHDKIVLLDDIIEFYAFLDTCVSKIFNTKPSEVCGFIQVNGDAVVSYVTYENTKYVPLFYFEEVQPAQLNVVVLTGWHLSYLKFCYKVQGIRDCYSKSNECTAVSLDDIQRLLGAGAVFEEHWPKDLKERSAFINDPTAVPTGQQTSDATWYRVPDDPPFATKQIIVSNTT